LAKISCLQVTNIFPNLQWQNYAAYTAIFMDPPAKRTAVPLYPLRLAGSGCSDTKNGLGAHRVWPAIVSTVRVLAVDVTRATFEHPASQWQLSGWCGDGVPIFVAIVCGDRVLAGQVGVEIHSVLAAPVTVQLPGGGRQRVQPYRRMSGGLAEIFVDAVCSASRLRRVSVAEATAWIARLDAEKCAVTIYSSRQRHFDAFCGGSATLGLWHAIISDEITTGWLGSDLLELAPEKAVIEALFMIDQRCHAARVALTPTLLLRIAASLAMHCYRYKFGWYTVSRLIEKMLGILGVSQYKLQRHLAATAPFPAAKIDGLCARAADAWPGLPGSMVALALSFEEAVELGCAFRHGEMPAQMALHRGAVYLGPGAVGSGELRGTANARLVDAMTLELRLLADRMQEGDQDMSHTTYWLSELAVPLAFGSASERVMSAEELDDKLEEISCDSLRFEERRQIGKALALGFNTEERAHYYERFVEAMKKYNGGKSRTDELLRWMKWYMMSRGIS
jgi:hypothetical protein